MYEILLNLFESLPEYGADAEWDRWYDRTHREMRRLGNMTRQGGFAHNGSCKDGIQLLRTISTQFSSPSSSDHPHFAVASHYLQGGGWVVETDRQIEHKGSTYTTLRRFL